VIVIAALLAAWLGLASVIDAKRLILPDLLTLPLIPAGLFLVGLQPPALTDRLLGAVIGFTVFAAISVLYRRLRRRDGLGLGDAKLLAAAGAWVGWQGLPSVVLIASLGGLAWALVTRADGDRQVPFGPFLALGFWLVWWLGPLEVTI
jgi:leader peptidase (prepilin peptidase)/N-methyltransferase